MWYDVAMKSGRALAGAQARFGAKHVTRVGSPLGTSFRFQLDNAAGLEYTRLLREKLEATLDRAKAHHAEMISRIEAAKRNAAEETGSVALCSDIASRFKRDVVDHLTTTLRRIETLGHTEERTDPTTGETRVERVNSLEAYKKAMSELDNIRVQNTVTHDVPEDVVAGIDGAIQEIAASLTGGNLLGSAPVPTAYTIEETVYSDKDIGHTGPLLKITLTDPQPVAEGMSSWIDLYRKIAADIGRREGDRVLAVREAEGHRTKSQGTALDLPGLKTRELEELVQFAKDMSLAPELSSAEQGGDLNLAVQTLATPEPGGSYVIINPQTDEREGGPFTTLAAARAEIESRRSQVLPTSRRGAPDEDPWRNVIAAFDISLADDLGNARRSSSRAASGDRYQAILDTTLRSMLGAAISGSHLHGKGDQSRHQTAMRLLRNLIKHDPAQLATFESLLSAAKAAFDRAGKVEISAGATRSYGGLGGEAAAAVSRLMERMVSDADPNADWDQSILLLPTLSDAIQSSLEEANAVGVFSSDTGGSERMTTLRGIQFARVSFEISPALKRAQAEFDRVTKAQISVIVKQLADVSGLFEGAKDQVGAEIARRMQANIKRLSDLLTLFSGGSTAGYQHLLSANHTATSRPRGALVAAGAVHVQPDQADGPARRAAFMEEQLQAAVEPLASIVASGKITVRSVELFERETAIGPVRMSASERSTRDQVTSITSRIEEIKSSHERHQLAQINLVADIPSLVDRMIQMTDVVSTDQVCVPITLPAEGELTESGRRDAITAALQARMGSTLPEDIVDAVLGAIEPL
jgi:hypothetical protein